MGKNIKQTKEQKEEEKEEQKQESETIREKKAHTKVLTKSVKQMEGKVKQQLAKKQVIKAVAAIKAYLQKEKEEKKQKNLLEDEDCFVHLNFTLTQVPSNPSPKPFRIDLPFPFYGKANQTRACLIVKDPSREFKDTVKDLSVPCLAKVIGYTSLKKNYKQFKDKKALLSEYDVFLSDLRVYSMLPECLGKEFYSKKKFPFPLKVHGFSDPKKLQSQINKAIKASYFTMGNGPNYSVRVGRTTQEDKEIADNVEKSLAHCLGQVAHLDDIKFSALQSVTLKAGNCPELPVFNQLQKSDLLAYLESRKN